MMLQTLDHQLTVTIARAYYKNVDNAAMFLMMTKVEQCVERVTSGKCVVRVECFDGEHGDRRAASGQGTGQGAATEAKAYAKVLALDAAEGGAANAHIVKAKKVIALAKWAQENTDSGLVPAWAGGQNSGAFMTPHSGVPLSREQMHAQRPQTPSPLSGLFQRGTTLRWTQSEGQVYYGEVLSSKPTDGGVRYQVDFHGRDGNFLWLSEEEVQGLLIDEETYMQERTNRFLSSLDMPLAAFKTTLHPLPRFLVLCKMTLFFSKIMKCLSGDPANAFALSSTCLRMRRALRISLRFRVEARALLLPGELAGQRRAHYLDKGLQANVQELVWAIPSPVVEKPRLITPTADAHDWPLHLLFDRRGLNYQAKSELATLHRLQGEAEAFVRKTEVASRAKSMTPKVKRLTQSTGVGTLNSLAKSFNLNVAATIHDKQPCITAILDHLRALLQVKTYRDMAAAAAADKAAAAASLAANATAAANVAALAVAEIGEEGAAGTVAQATAEAVSNASATAEVAAKTAAVAAATATVATTAATAASAAEVAAEHEILLDLEETSRTPGSFSPTLSVGVLTLHVANLKLRQIRKEAMSHGRFYIPPPGTAISCVDPYHNFHNFVTHLLKQLIQSGGDNGVNDDGGGSDAGGEEGDGGDIGENVLVLKHLLRAAKELGDRDLLTILNGSFDRHSHLCTSYVLDHPPLWEKMRALGYAREAVVLKVMGGAYAAWCKPHSTEGARTRSLHLLSIMVHRLFGPGMLDVRVLTSKSFGGFPTRQWQDFVANADARAAVLESLPPDLRKVFKETSMTTISVESSFSLLPSSAGSSAKPPATEIQGNAPKLDMVRDIKRRATDEEYQESKRKRKLSDLHGGGSWNDGNWKNRVFNVDRKRAIKRYTKGRMDVRLLNQKRGGMA